MDGLLASVLAVIASAVALYLVRGRHTKHPPVFPGPRPLPFVGNPSYLLAKDYWVKLSELSKTYGMRVTLFLVP